LHLWSWMGLGPCRHRQPDADIAAGRAAAEAAMMGRARRAWGSAEPSEEERLTMLKRKIGEVEALLSEGSEECDEERFGTNGPVASGPSTRTVVRFPGERGDVVVIIGTSDHARIPGHVERISQIVDAAYTGAGKHKRVSTYDAMDRLEMGDAGPRANRVLHLAYKGEALVGCASSTFSPGWTPEGCGHWGLLAVDPEYQGAGVATALVIAAERRLAQVSEAVQIEYEYTEGEDFSRRLMSWYESKLGFDGGPRPRHPGQRSFRRCFKDIPEDAQRRGQRRRLQEIRTWLAEQIAETEGSLSIRKSSTQSTRFPEEEVVEDESSDD